MQGIWVRSQNKEDLIYCSEFQICTWSSGLTDIYGNRHVLAKYSTKEKALSILDDLMHTVISYRNVSGAPVFLMPDDD